jgi:hypothetical protein
MICAVMEAEKGMPTALAGAAQLRATFNSKLFEDNIFT